METQDMQENTQNEQDMQDMPSTQNLQKTQEKTSSQGKSTKDRLDELRGLHNTGYISEAEFKSARVGILKDGGFDITARQQQQQQNQYAHRPSYREREEEEAPQNSGCGCLLMTFLLLFLMLGILFFAAPHLPERLGGATIMAAREWAVDRAVMLISHFRGQTPAPVQAPVSPVRQVPAPVPAFPPVSYNDERREEILPIEQIEQPEPEIEAGQPVSELVEETEEAEVEESVEPISTETTQIPAQPAFPPVTPTTLPTVPSAETGAVALPPIDENLLRPAPGTSPAEPELVVIEPPAAASVRGQVTAANVRIRSTPDTAADNVIGWARQGDRFTVLEEGRDRNGARWLYVVYDTGNRRGWTSASLVRLDN